MRHKAQGNFWAYRFIFWAFVHIEGTLGQGGDMDSGGIWMRTATLTTPLYIYIM